MITEDAKNNQYEIMFKKPEAISLAPNCNGIKRLENVPDTNHFMVLTKNVL